MLASFGLLYVVQNVARIIWGSQTYSVIYLNRTVTGAQIPLNRLVALAVCRGHGRGLLLLPGPDTHGQSHPGVGAGSDHGRD